MTYILTKNLTIYKSQAEDSDAYHVIEKSSKNIILIFKDEVIFTHDDLNYLDLEKLKISIEIPSIFMNNIEEIDNILRHSPFKPYYPTHYDIINDTYICEHEDGNTYVYDPNICDYINEDDLENDHLYSKDEFFRIDMDSLDGHVKKQKFENYFDNLSEEEKDDIIGDVNNLFVIKVKDFVKPFIAHRVYGNNKSNYFEHNKGYFFVKRGDGTEYKYSFDSVESYIHIYDFNNQEEYD